MIATAVSLAILWFVGTMLGELVRQNRDKILAALEGRSWASERRPPAQQMAGRINPRYTAAEPAILQPGLRAAA